MKWNEWIGELGLEHIHPFMALAFVFSAETIKTIQLINLHYLALHICTTHKL
jgi:hypothetical protein